MRLYQLERTQNLPVSMDDAWAFFSNPDNLADITPPWLNFKLMQPVSEPFHAGMIISYRLTPVSFIPVNWITEITHVRKPHFFVDEQRFGPYAFWHHQHIFEDCNDGTVRMSDIVHYAIGYGVLGDIIHRFMVLPRLEKIFDFRFETLRRLFGDTDVADEADNRYDSEPDNTGVHDRSV